MRASLAFLLMTALGGEIDPARAQGAGRISPPTVGASMAVLATLQDAGVLPPEGTPDANRVIQIVIQLQSAFMKSADPAIGDFLGQSLHRAWGAQAEDIGLSFRAKGWTSEVLEALSRHYAALSRDERARIEPALMQFNMRLRDLEHLLRLFDVARARFNQRGQDIHTIFAAHRRTMPDSDSRNRKERRDGDQGIYSHQSKGGADQGRPAGSQEALRG
jgi:hypothetical protein